METGTPRVVVKISAASVSFTNQSINALDASMFLESALIDQNMDGFRKPLA
ncbi:hypothetical protein D3C85_1743490 [compost metagenome]